MTEQNKSESTKKNSQESGKNNRFWRVIAVCGVIAIAAPSAVSVGKALFPQYFQTSVYNNHPQLSTAESSKTPTMSEPLLSWSDTSEAKKRLTNFVKNATDPTNGGYIPEERRIAVFDLDGALMSNSSPYNLDWMLFLYRVLQDDSYKPDEKMKEFALNKVLPAVYSKEISEDLKTEFAKYNNEAFSGLDEKQFTTIVNKFLNTPTDGQEGLTYGDSFYIPMREAMDYLRSNNFECYVISSMDRMTARAVAVKALNLQPDHVIASDTALLSSSQGHQTGTSHVFSKGDDLSRGTGQIYENDNMNKVSAIYREIGLQPVIAFGSGLNDESMLAYTISQNSYPSLSLMIINDDIKRGHGNTQKALEEMDLAVKNGFVPVSLASDFEKLFLSGVTSSEYSGYLSEQTDSSTEKKENKTENQETKTDNKDTKDTDTGKTEQKSDKTK